MNAISRLAAMLHVVAAATIALGACSEGDPETAAETAAASSQNRELLEAVQQPLDRARAVEDISGARKGELDQEIEAAE